MAVMLNRSRRMLAVVLLLMLGLSTLQVLPVAAANCADLGPGKFLAGCDLSGLDLSGVNLAGSNLRGANLEGANLEGADLSGANLSNATLTEGALDNANTAGSNLRGITWIPASNATITDVFIYRSYPGNDLQAAAVTGSGFEPEARITFTVIFDIFEGGNFLNNPPYVFADGTGAFNSGIDTNTWIRLNCAANTITVEATDGTNTASWTGTLPAC